MPEGILVIYQGSKSGFSQLVKTPSTPPNSTLHVQSIYIMILMLW